MKNIHFIKKILYIIALFAIIGLNIICIIILPNSISKYLVLFYLIALGILIFLLLISEIIEIENLKNNKQTKLFAYFKDISWQSYIYYTIIIFPLITIIVLVAIIEITQKRISPEVILQCVYWTLVLGNFIWFYWHFKKANTSIKIIKFNLMLKLATCIVSGIGFLWILSQK